MTSALTGTAMKLVTWRGIIPASSISSVLTRASVGKVDYTGFANGHGGAPLKASPATLWQSVRTCSGTSNAPIQDHMPPKGAQTSLPTDAISTTALKIRRSLHGPLESLNQDRSEKAQRPAVGDTVKIISGYFQGETGTIVEDLASANRLKIRMKRHQWWYEQHEVMLAV